MTDKFMSHDGEVTLRRKAYSGISGAEIEFIREGDPNLRFDLATAAELGVALLGEVGFDSPAYRTLKSMVDEYASTHRRIWGERQEEARRERRLKELCVKLSIKYFGIHFDNLDMAGKKDMIIDHAKATIKREAAQEIVNKII